MNNTIQLWLFLLVFPFGASLSILALHFAFMPGNVFAWFASAFRKHAPEWVLKPGLDCPACMASLWGTVFFWFFSGRIGGMDFFDALAAYPFMMLLTSGLCLVWSGIAYSCECPEPLDHFEPELLDIQDNL